MSDNGVQFRVNEFAELLEAQDVHSRTSLYYFQANCAVKHWNHVLKEALLTADSENKPWKQLIQDFLSAYGATLHATGVPPFDLMLCWLKKAQKV